MRMRLDDVAPVLYFLIRQRHSIRLLPLIAAVDGVDGVFIGPSDLAAAFGHLGNAGHGDVQAAIAHVFDRAKAAGKPCGILAHVQQDAERYLSMGATIVSVCADMGLLRSAALGVHKHFIPA